MTQTCSPDQASKEQLLAVMNTIDLARFSSMAKATGAVIQRLDHPITCNYASDWHYVEDLLTQIKHNYLDVWKN